MKIADTTTDHRALVIESDGTTVTVTVGNFEHTFDADEAAAFATRAGRLADEVRSGDAVLQFPDSASERLSHFDLVTLETHLLKAAYAGDDIAAAVLVESRRDLVQEVEDVLGPGVVDARVIEGADVATADVIARLALAADLARTTVEQMH